MNGTETLVITDVGLYNPDINHTIMHRCETKISKRMAEIVTQNGGDILELGFGMHISADFILENPNVTSYTVIEIHPQQYERALEWAKTKTIPINVILGNWTDILPLSDMKFDGVYFDTDTDGNLPFFMDVVKPNCKEGTILSFYAYYKHDARLNSEIIRFTDDEVTQWPVSWKRHKLFQNNQYVIYHTKFNGENFYSDSTLKPLI
jgi:hypothetical protein